MFFLIANPDERFSNDEAQMPSLLAFCGPGKRLLEVGKNLKLKRTCEQCDIGHYQPYDNIDKKCVPCPNNMTTSGKGSKTVQECFCKCYLVVRFTLGLTFTRPCPENTNYKTFVFWNLKFPAHLETAILLRIAEIFKWHLFFIIFLLLPRQNIYNKILEMYIGGQKWAFLFSLFIPLGYGEEKCIVTISIL